jgi:hypothetical protein
MYNDLSFNNTDLISDMQSTNIGGPPFPFTQCQDLRNLLLTTTNPNLTNEQKREAYLNYVHNNGYIIFDYKKITDNNLQASKIIINNTSFFIFFSLFIIFFILILLLMIYQYLDLMHGLYIILLFSLVIYIASVIYRKNTISSIEASTIVLNSEIDQNKTQYENSIIQLPNHVVNVSQTLNS